MFHITRIGFEHQALEAEVARLAEVRVLVVELREVVAGGGAPRLELQQPQVGGLGAAGQVDAAVQARGRDQERRVIEVASLDLLEQGRRLLDVAGIHQHVGEQRTQRVHLRPCRQRHAQVRDALVDQPAGQAGLAGSTVDHRVVGLQGERLACRRQRLLRLADAEQQAGEVVVRLVYLRRELQHAPVGGDGALDEAVLLGPGGILQGPAGCLDGGRRQAMGARGSWVTIHLAGTACISLPLLHDWHRPGAASLHETTDRPAAGSLGRYGNPATGAD